MPVDDRAFAARAAAITEASRRRVDRLQRELAEQQASARARGHLQRMTDLADRKVQETTAAAKRDGATTHGPTAPGAPKRTRARGPLGDDESFSDRHWLR